MTFSVYLLMFPHSLTEIPYFCSLGQYFWEEHKDSIHVSEDVELKNMVQ